MGLLHQSGVVPFRVVRDQVMIALITTTSGPQWTIPKGHLESGLSVIESAAKEAYEEAGLVGRVLPRSLGKYRYEKRGTRRVVEIFPMEVTKALSRWPEMMIRRREWLPLEKAARRVAFDEIGDMILSLEGLLQSASAMPARLRRTGS